MTPGWTHGAVASLYTVATQRLAENRSREQHEAKQGRTERNSFFFLRLLFGRVFTLLFFFGEMHGQINLFKKTIFDKAPYFQELPLFL